MLQGLEEMLGIALVFELEAKIIDNENKDDGLPLVLPQAWRCSITQVVAMFVQSLCENVIGNWQVSLLACGHQRP